MVGAAAYAKRPIGQCSGGEQQRLLIAQALIHRPKLLLDEPLDSLDLPTEAAVVALIDRIRREGGVAVVLVAHDVNPILPCPTAWCTSPSGAPSPAPPPR
ncbi:MULTISPECIES: ATP-binding cassette domain-containing protein [Streptomyces]|uniref:ATP-binding cassette domain-containing protein n=1 Tax=Streptomyces TaxID=1883 RepID=UPI0031D1511A